MDTRPRVLIVEDHDGLRESWVELLTEEGFKAHGAASLAEAKAAANRCSYHVALIDIMLKGDDTSNRDGVDVVRYLRWLQEDTHPLVISAQTQSRKLVRDLLREYGAVDYLDKEELEQKESGNSFLIERIRSFLDSPNAPPRIGDWSKLVKTLAQGSSEEAFVSECLRALKFKGGFENLNTALLHACNHLVPLLPEASGVMVSAPRKSRKFLMEVIGPKARGLPSKFFSSARMHRRKSFKQNGALPKELRSTTAQRADCRLQSWNLQNLIENSSCDETLIEVENSRP